MSIFQKGFSELANDPRLKDNGIKISVFGKYKTLPKEITKEIDRCIENTQYNNSSFLNFCIAYDGQSEIVEACRKISEEFKNKAPEEITKETIKANLFTAEFPAPDLIIRSGGEKRLSGFLLWDSSYSELYFSDKYWPEMKTEDLLLAIEDFQKKDRRFGQ